MITKRKVESQWRRCMAGAGEQRSDYDLGDSVPANRRFLLSPSVHQLHTTTTTTLRLRQRSSAVSAPRSERSMN